MCLLYILFLSAALVNDQEVLPFQASTSFQIHNPANLPDWVTAVPRHCFVGISAPCESINKARSQAMQFVISQILQSMGAEYWLLHESKLSNHKDTARHTLNEKLVFNSRWFIDSVNQNIVKSYIQQQQEKYVYFVLINFSSSKIEKLKKLTIGPKLKASLIDKNIDNLTIEVKEILGVTATLTDYKITVLKKNDHARFITLFAYKVDKAGKNIISRTLDTAAFLNKSSQMILVPNPLPAKDFKSILYGTKYQIKIHLFGHDEIGRKLSVPVTY